MKMDAHARPFGLALGMFTVTACIAPSPLGMLEASEGSLMVTYPTRRISTREMVPGPVKSVIVSEALIWIDEALQMPIRSEMTGSEGIKVTTELTEVVLDVDNRVFQVPDDYQKITIAEFMSRLGKH